MADKPTVRHEPLTIKVSEELAEQMRRGYTSKGRVTFWLENDVMVCRDADDRVGQMIVVLVAKLEAIKTDTDQLGIHELAESAVVYLMDWVQQFDGSSSSIGADPPERSRGISDAHRDGSIASDKPTQ